MNATDYVGVTFNDYGGKWQAPDAAVIRVVKAALKGAGASPFTVFSSPWRDRRSASGSGQAQTSEGAIYVSTRVVEMRELRGALTFIAVTATSKIEAGLLREQLERATQLLQ